MCANKRYLTNLQKCVEWEPLKRNPRKGNNMTTKTKATKLKGKPWHAHLVKHNLSEQGILDTYHSTSNYEKIFLLGGYFFCFRLMAGFEAITDLKKAMGK